MRSPALTVARDLATHAFLRSPAGVFTNFDAPGAAGGPNGGTWAVAINNAGDIAGYYMDASLVFHGFVRTPAGVYTTFEDPNAGMNHSSGYPGTVAYGINDAGAVVGMYTDANGVSHGFVRTPAGVFITIDAQGAGTALYLGTTAFSINDAGAIAGYYLDANKLYHGFFRTPAGAITTFDGPDASTTTWGTQALSIGNAGEIAGTYVGTDLSNHGFILAPK
ncbi:MAG: hypothetical protein ABSC93_31000 [Bryobacteraceae bacterium]